MESQAPIDTVRTSTTKWLPNAALIVGAGPAGLATAASLTSRGVPYTLVERAGSVGYLWRNMTYDRLHLHLPKQFCQLPLHPFPATYPTYPTRDQFISYLEDYATHFNINPVFNTFVKNAQFSSELGLWIIVTEQKSDSGIEVVHYMARWIVVASGENAEPIVPVLKGREDYSGIIMHGSEYRNGRMFRNKKALVVGCGNTGMEVALDLANFNAKPTLVVRSPVNVMPRDLFGLNIPTFMVCVMLMKFFPIWLADNCIIFLSWLTMGSTGKYGIVRPQEGPLAFKARTGQTPVLDVGTVAKVKSGQIKVMPQIECLTPSGVRFVNGVEDDFEVIILATGYASTVPLWLKGDGLFGSDGFPTTPFPNGWKGEHGLYSVGFGRKGLLGCGHDAVFVATAIKEDSMWGELTS